MAKHSPDQSLTDIYSNIEAARRYVDGVSADAFKQNDEKVQAVLHRLLKASEAAIRLRREWPERYEEFALRYPRVSWQRFRGLGDRYRHGYDIVDLDLVLSDLNGYLRDVQAAIMEELPLVKVSSEG